MRVEVEGAPGGLIGLVLWIQAHRSLTLRLVSDRVVSSASVSFRVPTWFRLRELGNSIVIAPNPQEMRNRVAVHHVLNERYKLSLGQQRVDCDGWLSCYLCWQPWLRR